MSLLRSFPKSAFILVLLSMAGFCVAWKSVDLLLLCGALAALSWYITEGPRGRHLPRWVSNILILAASLNVFADLMQHRQDMLGVLGRFAIWLTLIKLYERKAARDYAQLLTLSLLLVIVSCLQSADLLFGLILVVYAGLGLHVLLLYQLHAAFEKNKSLRKELIPADYRLAPPLRPIIGRHADLHFRTLVVGVGLTGIVMSMLIFVSMPRDIGQGFLTRMARPSGFGAGGGTGQLPSEVNLTSGSRITESRKAVMNVAIRDSGGHPVRLEEPLLMRGFVLDTYDDEEGRWIASEKQQSTRAIRSVPNSLLPLSSSTIEPGETYTQDVTLLTPIKALYGMYVPVAVQTDASLDLIFDLLRQTVTIESGATPEHYIIKSQPAPSAATLRALAGPGGMRVRASYDNADVTALARQQLRAAGLPTSMSRSSPEYWSWSRAAADQFVAYLGSGKYEYTLDLRDVVDRGGEREDPTARFLLTAQKGHCEYFASALAGMCQTVGIQARVVTGFIGYEYDESAEQYIIRESNAHAWVEVRTGQHEWTTFDATPEAPIRQMHTAERTFADRLRWIYDTFEFKWNTSVVTFDSRSQQRLAESMDLGLSQRVAGALKDFREFLARVNQFFALGPAGYIWMGFVGCVLVIAIAALIKLMRRTRAIHRTLRLQHLRGREYQRMLRQLGFYLDMLSVLRQGGAGKPLWQPPQAFAEQLQQQRPAAATLVGQITDLFYAARYGHERLSRQQMSRAHSLVAELAQSLRVRHRARRKKSHEP